MSEIEDLNNKINDLDSTIEYLRNALDELCITLEDVYKDNPVTLKKIKRHHFDILHAH